MNACFFGCVGGDLGWNPAVAVAEEGEEEGAAGVDLFQAKADDFFVFGFVLGDAPAEVDVVELNAMGQKLFAEFGEGEFNQMIALRVHVAEGGGEEDADVLPTGHREYLRGGDAKCGAERGRDRAALWFDWNGLRGGGLECGLWNETGNVKTKTRIKIKIMITFKIMKTVSRKRKGHALLGGLASAQCVSWYLRRSQFGSIGFGVVGPR